MDGWNLRCERVPANISHISKKRGVYGQQEGKRSYQAGNTAKRDSRDDRIGEWPGVWAGFSAAISGFVRDVTGLVVPVVSVTVRHVESGLTRTSLTSENGGYNIQGLPVGPYELTTDLQGFKQQVRRGINLAVGQEAVVNLTLETGGKAEQVTVTREAQLVNTTVNSTSGSINEGQIKDMPVNGRSFEQLLTLNTGTVNNNVHSSGSSFLRRGSEPNPIGS